MMPDSPLPSNEEAQKLAQAGVITTSQLKDIQYANTLPDSQRQVYGATLDLSQQAAPVAPTVSNEGPGLLPDLVAMGKTQGSPETVTANQLISDLNAGKINVQDYATKMAAIDQSKVSANQVANVTGPQAQNGFNTPTAQPAPEQRSGPISATTDQVKAALSNQASQASVSPSTNLPVATMSGTGGGVSTAPHKQSIESELLGNIDNAHNIGLQAFGRQQDAIGRAADIQSKGSLQQAAIINQGVQADQDYEREQREDLSIANQKAQQTYAEIRKEIDVAKATEVDPQHWFKQRGIAGTIGAAIAVGLGALGVGMSSMYGKGTTQNYALQMISKSIDDDVESQSKNIEQKWKGITAKMDVANKEFVVDQAVRAEKERLRASAWMRVGQQVDSVQKSTDSELVGANADKLKAGIDLQIADSQDKYGKQIYDVKSLQRSQAQAAAAAAAGPYKRYQEYVQQSLTARNEASKAGNDPNSISIMPYSQFARTMGGMGDVSAGPTGSKLTYDGIEQVPKHDRERAVIGDDGKVHMALNERSAKDYQEYSSVKGTVQQQISVMKNAVKNGDPARYEAARGILLETMPKMLGYNRGPSQAQVKETFGPESIPHYVHWYSPSLSSRANEKVANLDETIQGIDKAMNTNTFGGQAKEQSQAAPPNPKAW